MAVANFQERAARCQDVYLILSRSLSTTKHECRVADPREADGSPCGPQEFTSSSGDAPVPAALPFALTAAFLEVEGKIQQLSGFVRRLQLAPETPALAVVGQAIAQFVLPLFESTRPGRA